MGEFTYEHLFDVLRRERGREELQELDTDFYAAAEAYIEDTAAKARSADVMSAEGDKLRTQLQNAKKLLKELYDRREKKIMLLALNKARTQSHIIDTNPLLAKERALYEKLVEDLSSFRRDLAPVINGAAQEQTAPKPAPRPAAPAPEPEPEPAADSSRVRITAPVPKFLGADKQAFGPYDEGEEVDLPEKIARILVKKGRAEQA